VIEGDRMDFAGRRRMEDRYGEVGAGGSTIVVNGMEFRLKRIFSKWMMDVPEVWTIDGGILGEDRYWIRFLDTDDRYVVVFEFNGNFEILSEMRVDSMA
jgi:transposase InsO family protein